MNYGTLNGILTTEKTFRGNISQPLAILINEVLAREIIDARGNEKSLPDRLNTFVTYTYANLHYNVGKTTKEGGEIFNDYANNQALREHTHSEGGNTKAVKPFAHSEGQDTIANNWASHSEGFGTQALGERSHSQNELTVAIGRASHTQGIGTYMYADGGNAEGRYNKLDKLKIYASIVGNGTAPVYDKDGKTVLVPEKRSNAYTLDWSGNGWFAGTVEATSVILRSITPNSEKKFKIVVDDSGTISATEYISEVNLYELE